MKHPPIQYPDEEARELLERFIKGETTGKSGDEH